MISTICTILVLFQLAGLILTVTVRKNRFTIYYGFILWHLSLIFFMLDGQPLYVPLIHIICCALAMRDLSHLKVVKILEINDDNGESQNDERLDEIRKIVEASGAGIPGNVKMYSFTLQEKRFFGLSIETRKMSVPVSLEQGDEEVFKKTIVGHQFDIIT